jgi:hypothetical protein
VNVQLRRGTNILAIREGASGADISFLAIIRVRQVQ